LVPWEHESVHVHLGRQTGETSRLGTDQSDTGSKGHILPLQPSPPAVGTESPTRPDSGNRWQNVDAMGDMIQPSSELVFEARQSGVEKRGVEHDLVKECRLNLVESGF